MHSFGVIATPLRWSRSSFAVVCLTLALVATSALAAASPVKAADPEPLKAVIIVGPAGSQTSADLADAEQIATLAESYGMDVRRVFHPRATWARVLANIQGANLVYYAGHGYGWPSPYTKILTEARQNGFGLNSFEGSGVNSYTYYGANVIRANVVLAPNAIVFLNHDCYTAGNGEPGMAIPGWDVARQRVDNFAAGFLTVGAEAVFAYSYQRFNTSLNALLTTDQTVEQVFRISGQKPHPYWGWIGSDPRKFNSVRTPGAQNFLDPHSTMGFLRAVSGDLSLTGAQWRAGVGNGQPPEISNFAAQTPGVAGFGAAETPFFTPNGDGVTDTMSLSFSVDREAFVDMVVKNQSGDVVRKLTAWSPGGAGNTTWDGKNANGAYVPDGAYTVRAVPHNRAGTEGNHESLDLMVMTTMRSPSVSPNMLFASDGDSFARTTTLSVNLQSAATFWWKIADANGNVVRTFINGVSTSPGNVSFQWDGRDGNGAFVPDGTYHSVTTTTTSAGTYFHSLPVYVGAFRLTTTAPTPFKRGTKAKFYVYSAEPLSAKPRIRVFAPGLASKTYRTRGTAAAGYYATVTFPSSASAGTLQIRVFGSDKNYQAQQTTYSFQLK